MDLAYATELLRSLADGVNPLTGEILPPNDSCNQVEIVRALHTVLTHLSSYKAPKPQPQNAGKPWTEEDDAILCHMYESNCPSKDICAYFKRSEGAIAARLVKLGEISEREDFRKRK